MVAIRVAGAQIPVTTDIDANQKEILDAIQFAKDEKADILLTPEGSLSGYTPHFNVPDLERALACVTAAARGAKIGLALGTCHIHPQTRACSNQIRFYAKNGKFMGLHTKTLLCGSLDDPPQGEINDYAVQPLRTFQFQGVQIAGLICNDMWANPACTPMPDTHLTQQLAQRGARIVFHAVNGGRNGGPQSETTWNFHESNLLIRAQAGRLWIVTADNCAPLDKNCSAPSGVIDPKGQWQTRTQPQGREHFAHTITLQ